MIQANSIRAAICGPSECGKPNVLLPLLFGENSRKFKNIYVHSKSLSESKYQLLQMLNKLLPVQQWWWSNWSQRRSRIVKFHFCICKSDKQKKRYFSMGWQKSIYAEYIDFCVPMSTIQQNPKQLIGDNCNIIVPFKKDECNLRHIPSTCLTRHHIWALYETVFRMLGRSIWNSRCRQRIQT